MIQDGINGLLAKAGSPESFADKLVTLIDDPNLRRTLGAAARRTAEEEYTDTRVAKLAEEIYRECLKRQ